MHHLKYLNSVYISIKEFVTRLLTLKIIYFARCMRPGGRFGNKMADKMTKNGKKCEFLNLDPGKKVILDKILIVVLIRTL